MAQREQGTPGLTAFGGQIHEEFLRELRGKEGYKRFDEMRRNSPVVGAMLYYHEMAIRKVSWNFANKANRKAQDERVDFLNYSREQMTQSWNDFISESLSFLPFGYSLFYPLYKRDKNNKLVWDAFSPRKQNTIFQWILNYPNTEAYDQNHHNGDILGFIQQAPPSYTMDKIEMNKVLHFRTRVEMNNPEGISLLRNAWVPYYFTKNLQGIEAIGYERDLNGLPVVKMPQGATTDPDDPNSDLSKASVIVRNVRVDEQGGVVLPVGWDFLLLSGAGKGFADIGRTIERYESRTLMAMLSQWIMLAQNGIGSAALSTDHTSIAEMVVDTTTNIIAETVTKQEIPRLLKLNGWTAEDIVLEHTPAGDTDISMFADFLQKVTDKLTWDASDELWLRQLAGLPEKTEEEIESAMEEKQAAKDAMREAFLQRTDGNKPEDKPGAIPPKEENAITLFGADKPPDERARRRSEKAYNDAVTALFAKQKRRIMKAAREMKGQ